MFAKKLLSYLNYTPDIAFSFVFQVGSCINFSQAGSGPLSLPPELDWTTSKKHHRPLIFLNQDNHIMRQMKNLTTYLLISLFKAFPYEDNSSNFKTVPT
jgi:hypothetical protein